MLVILTGNFHFRQAKKLPFWTILAHRGLFLTILNGHSLKNDGRLQNPSIGLCIITGFMTQSSKVVLHVQKCHLKPVQNNNLLQIYETASMNSIFAICYRKKLNPNLFVFVHTQLDINQYALRGYQSRQIR